MTDCYWEDDGSDDEEEDDGWKDYPSGGAIIPPNTGNNNNNTNSSPKAKNIFRNSNMTETNWAALERMLDKIMADCMGEALYYGLAELLGDQTLSIQFNNGTGGSFGPQGESVGISLGGQMESNQLFHEMMHAYRAYQETLSSYNDSMLNGEIEAWYAQYLYTSRLPEYPGSKWEKRDNTDPRRRKIKDIAQIIDDKGNLHPGKSSWDLSLVIENEIVPTFHQNHYSADKYPFDYDRPGLENFTNLRKLTINCL